MNRLIDRGIVDSEYRTSKSCPGHKVDMDEIRALVAQELSGGGTRHTAREPGGDLTAVLEAIDVLRANEDALGNAAQEWREFVYNGEIQGLIEKAALR